MNTNNTVFYFLIVGIFVLFKLGFSQVEVNQLVFLLKPTNEIIEILMGSKAVFQSNSGFYHEKLNIIIDKSCAGFNFWALSFLIFNYLILNHLNKSMHKILSIPLVLIFTYFFTILVNTSRIYVSIIVQSQTPYFHFIPSHLMHESIGIITNLTFLVIIYFSIQKLIIRKNI